MRMRRVGTRRGSIHIYFKKFTIVISYGDDYFMVRVCRSRREK